jgi:hypothetical protein
MSPTEPRKLNLKLSGDAVVELRRLAEEEGTTMTEIVRLGL